MTDGETGGDASSAVLYYEADQTARDAIRTHEEWADVTIDAAADTSTALELLDERQYDALIVNPESLPADGESFATTVATDDPDLPVLLYTDLPSSDIDDELLSSATTLVEKGTRSENLRLLRDKVSAINVPMDGPGPGLLDTYKVLAEAARDGIYVLGGDGRLQYVNESMTALLGYDEETLVGMHSSRLMAPGELERGQQLIQEMIAAGESESDVFDMRFRTSDDEEVIVGLNFSIIYDEGTYAGIVGVARDVTKRREREWELERQNERLDQFASVVSHDLRNPLNVATLRLDLAMEECDSEHLDTVADAHDRMEELIESLLVLAREGETVTDREQVDLAAVATDCWAGVDVDDMTLAVDVDRTVRADESRLKQLFENLFCNAIDHGCETVRVGDLDDGFFVEDDGPGIPEDDREAVFEAGYSTTTDGLGFGLSIVKQMVESHGWEISITEGTDGGARFEITGLDPVMR